MALLDIIIDTLRINCSVVQCTGYASEIEALFYLFFFPTVFIILLVYILTNFIFRGDGNAPRGLRLLISVTLYAFIVMEGLYTMFVSLSRFWWLFAVILMGLWAFMRHLIGGGGSGGGAGGKMPGFGGGSGPLGYFGKKVRGKLEESEKKKRTQIEQEISNLRSSVNLMEKELEKPSPGTDMTKMIGEYHNHKKFILTLTDELSEMGKANVVGIDWNIEKLEKEYEDKLKELDKKVEDITKKVYKQAA